MPEPVYLTINEFPGTGAAAPTVVDFNFSGGYISRSHVKAEILDPLTAVRTPVPVTDASFVTDFRLSLPVVVPVGRILRVYRKTPNEQPLVDFTNGARIAETNLDLVARQAVFVSAEMADTVTDLEVSEILADISAAANGAAAAQAAAELAAAAASSSAAAADVSEAAAVAAEVSAEAAAVSSAASAAAAVASNGALATALAASGGSNQVGFLQSGVGAVLRFIQGIFRERLSITDFGAVATPGVDNTAAIQAAINEALASGRALRIPAGLNPFEHASPLTVPYDPTNTRRLRIVGDHGLAYFATGRTSALRYTGTTGHAITVQGRAGGQDGNNQGHPVSFELDRVAWIGNASCLGAVRIARGWYASITKNSFFGFSNAAGSVVEFDSDDVDAGGISFSGTSKIEDNNFATSGRCIVITGSTGGVVNALTIRGNVMLDQQYGVISQFSPGVPFSQHIVIEGNHFEGTIISDIFSQGAASNWVIERNYIEQNNPGDNSPRIDIQGSANFAITVQRNLFSKQLQAAGQALVRVTNGKNISIINNISNYGGNTDRWSVDLTTCVESEAEPMQTPAAAIPYPVLMNNFPIRSGRVNDRWRTIPLTTAGNFVGVSGGDGWPGSTVSTVQAEINKTNAMVTLNFKITVTTKSGVVGNVLFGILPEANFGNEVCVPILAENVVGPKPIFLKVAAGATTGTLHDATGAALSYQPALAVGSVFHGRLQYLTQA